MESDEPGGAAPPDTSNATTSDGELAAALARGDGEALGVLFDRYGEASFALAVRILGDRGRAEDVVQDVFVRLWTNARQFDSGRGSLRTWILTSVRHRSVDYLRGRSAHESREVELDQQVPDSAPSGDPWHQAALSLERDAVREAVAALPPEQQQAVVLAYFGGYTQREIADMVRVPISTVKSRMRLGLEKLHSYLDGRGLVHR